MCIVISLHPLKGQWQMVKEKGSVILQPFRHLSWCLFKPVLKGLFFVGWENYTFLRSSYLGPSNQHGFVSEIYKYAVIALQVAL